MKIYTNMAGFTRCVQTGPKQLSFITPIRRKGCKNVGWIWSEKYQQKVVVPLHPGKPIIFVTKKI